MSTTDLNLVAWASENARLKLKEAATVLKKSPQALAYTLQQAEKQGILSTPFAAIDYSFLGLLLFKVYCKGSYLTDEEKAGVASALRKNDYVAAVYTVEGEYDLCVELLAPNPSRFNKEFRAINAILKHVPEYRVVLNVVSHHYPRHYLPKNPVVLSRFSSEIVMGGDRPKKDFSPEEMAVMKALAKDPCSPLTKLAEHAQMHAATFKKTLQQLQEQKIVRNCKYVFNAHKAGMEHVRLLIDMQVVSEQDKAALLEYAKSRKEITQLHWTIGDWTLELDVEAKDRPQLRKSLIEFRQAFKTVIRSVQIIEVYEYYARTYLPQFMWHEGYEFHSI